MKTIVNSKISPYIIMVVTCCYLERENDEVLKAHVATSSCFEISATLQEAPHLKASKLNKYRGLL